MLKESHARELAKVSIDQRDQVIREAAQNGEAMTARSIKVAAAKRDLEDHQQMYLLDSITKIHRCGGKDLADVILLHEVQISTQEIYRLCYRPEADLAAIAPQILAAGCFPLPKDQSLKEDINFEDNPNPFDELSSTSVLAESEESARQRSQTAREAVDKIGNIYGLGLKQALTTGPLESIIDADVITWSQRSDQDIKRIGSLVVKHWTVKDAIRSVDNAIDTKRTVEELINCCIQAKGKFAFEIGHFQFTVINDDLLTESAKLGK